MHLAYDCYADPNRFTMMYPHSIRNYGTYYINKGGASSNDGWIFGALEALEMASTRCLYHRSKSERMVNDVLQSYDRDSKGP